MWVFHLDSVKKLRSLPGLSPGEGKYLLAGMDQSTYWDFANCPVPIRWDSDPRTYMVDL
jgi:hypothetical protein